MTSALDRAMIRSRSIRSTATSYALQLKKAGSLPDILGSQNSGNMGQFSQYQEQGANTRRYANFRGWVYSAVNALAIEAAGQSPQVGKMVSDKTAKKPGGTKGNKEYRSRFGGKPIEKHQIDLMPKGFRDKAASSELEVMPDHPLINALEQPNPMQHNFQFVYSFVANLCLTGWAYIIGGLNEDGDPEFYSVPTTWVVPDHTKGAFAEIRIVNPRKPQDTANQEPLDRSQFAFAYLPNPSDPMSALAPASAQSHAIKIDDNIQTSQTVFFENSVFPGAIVTMGKNPHPDAPGGGTRPRLTAAQRRQVYGAIKKVMGGVANYGNPVIIDGMIESIERLSASQNEIGWEKSEKSVRTRILSAFSVHPFILGEEMAGSYAQAYVVEKRFAKRVNVYLTLLSEIMTGLAPPIVEGGDKNTKSKTLVWWEEATAKDPSMEQSMWSGARGRGDISQNEYRAFMGLPPDEDSNEAVIDKTSLQAISGLAGQVNQGALQPEQAVAILEGLGIPTDIAKKIAGSGPSDEMMSQQEDQGGFGGDNQDQNQLSDQSQFKSAMDDLDNAMLSLSTVEGVLEKSTGLMVID